MQYIFGDNRSSYAIIYTDGTQSEAQKLNSLLRFPIVPNEKYNNLGFLPYGTNSGNSLFFCIKKDKSIPRSCYFTHAFSREADPEYFSGDKLLDDIFADFIGQEDFDLLRDGGKSEVALRIDNELSAAADRKLIIDQRVLREAVASLYQKNKVLLVIDDENYSDNYVKVVLKQIFKYLTPSLRKATSYLSAVVETGSFEIMLRIVPKSMVADIREEYMNVNGSDFKAKSDTVFHELADFVMSESSPQQRKFFFKNYEVLYSGFESTYKKQNAEELFVTVANGDVQKLEKIVDGFLSKNVVERKEDITKCACNLSTVYNQESELTKRFVFEQSDIMNPAKILSNNSLFFYKLMLFADNGDAFAIQRLGEACKNIIISNDNCDAAINAARAVSQSAKDVSLKIQDKYFYEKLALPVYEKVLLARCLDFRAMREKATSLVDEAVAQMGPIEPSKSKEIKNNLVNSAVEAVSEYTSKDKNLRIADYIDLYTKNKMVQHNQDLMSGAKGGEVKYPNEIVLAKLAEIESALNSGKNNAAAEALIKEALGFQKEYRFMVDNLLALYAVKTYQSGNIKGISSFVRTNLDMARLEAVVSKMAVYEPSVAMGFILDVYHDFNKALDNVLVNIGKTNSYIDKLEAGQADAYIATVCLALKRCMESHSAEKKDIANKIQSSMSGCDKKSNVYKLLDSMKYVVKNGDLKKASSGGAVKDILLAVVSVIAVAAISSTILFATGVLGGEPKDDESQEQTEEASPDSSEEAISMEDSSAAESSEAISEEESSEAESVEGSEDASTESSTEDASDEASTDAEASDETSTDEEASEGETDVTSEEESTESDSESSQEDEGGLNEENQDEENPDEE